jgi:hypothetical protein
MLKSPNPLPAMLGLSLQAGRHLRRSCSAALCRRTNASHRREGLRCNKERRKRRTPNAERPISNLLVPKLCLGMTMSRQLCCPIGETEFQRQVRSQTEFGNEERLGRSPARLNRGKEEIVVTALCRRPNASRAGRASDGDLACRRGKRPTPNAQRPISNADVDLLAVRAGYCFEARAWWASAANWVMADEVPSGAGREAR